VSVLTPLRHDAQREWPETGAVDASIRLSRSSKMLLTGVAALSVLAFWVVHGSLIDDAYISLSYARNVAFHLHWGLIPQTTSNTASSPLNVLLLAALIAVLRHAVWATGVLFIGCHVVLGYCLLRTAQLRGLPTWTALAGSLLVLANPLLLSATGLEVALGAAVLGLLLLAAVQARPLMFGLIAGFAVLTRIDLVIFVLVLLVASPALRHGWRRILLGGAAVTYPWFAFSWTILGSALPDTLFIKTLQKSWGNNDFGNGPLLFLHAYQIATALAFVPAVLGTVSLLIRAVAHVGRRYAATQCLSSVSALGLAGIGHYLAYTKLGVPPYHWYYGPSLISLSVFLAFASGALLPTLLAKVSHWVPAILVTLILTGQFGFDAYHGLPWREAPITTNWATPVDYAAAGSQLGPLIGGHAVRSPGEIGTLAYFCGCKIVDVFADRAQFVPFIDDVKQHNGTVVQWLINLNFLFLDRHAQPIPVDYTLTSTPNASVGAASWPAGSSWVGKRYLVLTAGH